MIAEHSVAPTLASPSCLQPGQTRWEVPVRRVGVRWSSQGSLHFRVVAEVGHTGQSLAVLALGYRRDLQKSVSMRIRYEY